MSDEIQEHLRKLSAQNVEIRQRIQELLDRDQRGYRVAHEELKKIADQLASLELMACTLFMRQKHFDEATGAQGYLRHPSSL